jgi:hypothetical protein
MNTFVVNANLKGSKKSFQFAFQVNEELITRIKQVEIANNKHAVVLQIRFATSDPKALVNDGQTGVIMLPEAFAKTIISSLSIKKADNFQIVVNQDLSFFFTAELGKNKKQLTSALMQLENDVPVIVRDVETEEPEEELEGVDIEMTMEGF